MMIYNSLIMFHGNGILFPKNGMITLGFSIRSGIITSSYKFLVIIPVLVFGNPYH